MPAWVASKTHHAIIAALIEARKSAGMTQRDVATKIGKPPSFVGKVEAIERNLSVLEFIAWAKAVGADGGDLLRTVSGDLPEKIDI
jgi:transcriptional regulator with XRE-family HTH domain